MTAIDVFAGAGGMSTGAVHAGIRVRFAVEIDRFAAKAYRRNHVDCEVFADDIRRLPSDTIKSIPRGSYGTVVFGGPPCQGFSYSNTRTRSVDNGANWLFEEFVRVVRVWQPDFFVLENVQGIVNTAGGIIIDSIIEQFNRLRYDLRYGVLNAVDFGVPQRRCRFFMIGSRNRRAAQLPRVVRSGHTTVEDAIRDLPSLKNGDDRSWLPYNDCPPSSYATRLRGSLHGCSSHLVTKNGPTVVHRYRFVPPGGNWACIPAQYMASYKDAGRCHTGIYHRPKISDCDLEGRKKSS